MKNMKNRNVSLVAVVALGAFASLALDLLAVAEAAQVEDQAPSVSAPAEPMSVWFVGPA